MTQASPTRSVTQSLRRTLREDRDAVRDLLAEVLEEVALAHAIEPGRKTKPVKRDLVTRTLAVRR